VTDNDGGSATTDRVVQVVDGVPSGKLTGVSAAKAGTPFSLTIESPKFTPGRTTVAGSTLVTAAVNWHGRLSFKHALKVLGGHRTPRWAGAFSIVQRGDGATRKLTGQGYVLVKLSAHASLCLAARLPAASPGRRSRGTGRP
jgi:hypothetical protein